MSIGQNYCYNPQAWFNWTYQYVGGERLESGYIIEVAKNKDFNEIIFQNKRGTQATTPPESPLNNPKGTRHSVYVPVTIDTTAADKLVYGTNYYWRVTECIYSTECKTWYYDGTADGTDKKADAKLFTTSDKPWPIPQFDVKPSSPFVNYNANFIDKTICFNDTGETEDCTTMGNRQYTWFFGDGISDNTRGDVSHKYTKTGAKTVVLKVCDDGNNKCCETEGKMVPVRNQGNVPEWQEISPF